MIVILISGAKEGPQDWAIEIPGSNGDASPSCSCGYSWGWGQGWGRAQMVIEEEAVAGPRWDDMDIDCLTKEGRWCSHLEQIFTWNSGQSPENANASASIDSAAPVLAAIVIVLVLA